MKKTQLNECISIINSSFKIKIYEISVEVECTLQNNNRLFRNIASNYLKKGATEAVFSDNTSQIEAKGLTATGFLSAMPIWVTIKDYRNNDDLTLAGKESLIDHWSNVEPLFQYLKMRTNPHPIKTMVVVPLCFTSDNHMIHSPFGFISFESEIFSLPQENKETDPLIREFKRLAEIVSKALLEDKRESLS